MADTQDTQGHDDSGALQSCAPSVPDAAAQPSAAADASRTPEGAAGHAEAAAAPPEESFGELLAKSAAPGRDVSVGDKVSGVLVKIEGEDAFVDFGGRSEGVIRVAELRNAEGELEYSVGDPLEAFVAAAQDEVRLTRRIGAHDSQTDALLHAFRARIPVEGRVDAVNKWGLGVTIQGGARAFCPISQADSSFVQNAEEFRGKTLTFLITEFRDQGRNIVLSRRALLEAEQAKVVNEVRDRIAPGAELEGTVKKLESFGAFVDLGGGVEGLVHVSEISHKRVERPEDVLQVGQRVRVVVLRTRNLGSRRNERISLSMRALERDPWDEIRERYPEGTVVAGKIESLESFGAFVEIAPGVRGLLHVSEIADRRLAHPREELAIGQEVRVVVLEVDARRRRLRLSMKQVESLESAANVRDFQARRKQEAEAQPASSAMVDALRRANLID